LREIVEKKKREEVASEMLAPAEPEPVIAPEAVAGEAIADLHQEPEPLAGEPVGDDEEDEGESIFTQWWFWGATAAVAGAVVVGVILATGIEEREEPDPVGSGVVITTLRMP
jgi:hypothetical protein